MSKDKYIYTVKIPAVSVEFAKALDSVFPPIHIKHDTTENEIKWNAAQREVINWILKQATGTNISGNSSDLRKEPNNSELNKVLGRT